MSKRVLKRMADACSAVEAAAPGAIAARIGGTERRLSGVDVNAATGEAMATAAGSAGEEYKVMISTKRPKPGGVAPRPGGFGLDEQGRWAATSCECAFSDGVSNVPCKHVAALAATAGRQARAMAEAEEISAVAGKGGRTVRRRML